MNEVIFAGTPNDEGNGLQVSGSGELSKA